MAKRDRAVKRKKKTAREMDRLVRMRGEPAKLWGEYKRSRDADIRNMLIEEYLPLVKYVAERVRSKLPANVELDDLSSWGIFGLMDAIEGYDMSRGVKFETYCASRIRGAILDELRAIDWVPRLIRSKANRLDAAWRELEIELRRTPTEAEVAERLGMTLGEFDDMVREASAVTVVSLSERWEETSEENKALRKLDLLEDKKATNPVAYLSRKEIVELVTRGLSRKERLIVILYYFEELTMREIGLTLDLSESRVCQLHSRIMLHLQRQLEKRRVELMS
jgi:RNA polymerase sigma factor for flagellar operon FliA